MTENYILKQRARQKIKGKWLAGAVITLVLAVISGVLSWIPIIAVVATFLIYPLKYGYANIFYKLAKDNAEPEIADLFTMYSTRTLTTGILEIIYTFLWSLLLIIPGIIKSYSYAMTPYILADYPQLKNNEAIELSMKMMSGNKMKLFLLHLRFILWFLLSIVTLGIAVLFWEPYMETAVAEFYMDIKKDAMQ